MSSTGLIAEVLVLGGQAFVWLAPLALHLAPDPINSALSASDLNWSALATLLAVPGLAIAYALGWSIGFAAHRALVPLIKAYKGDTSEDGSVYRLAAIHFYQFASPALVEVFQLDRHVMRLTRGTALNFALIAVSLLLHAKTTPALFWAAGLAVVVSALALWHWTVRAREYYLQIRMFSTWYPSGVPATTEVGSSPNSPPSASRHLSK